MMHMKHMNNRHYTAVGWGWSSASARCSRRCAALAEDRRRRRNDEAERERAEAQLEEAQARLEAAAREIAELTARIVGDAGVARSRASRRLAAGRAR
jgi:hypothetical protein